MRFEEKLDKFLPELVINCRLCSSKEVSGVGPQGFDSLNSLLKMANVFEKKNSWNFVGGES
jgi:hypothetical protein